jgi:hypothetical protein
MSVLAAIGDKRLTIEAHMTGDVRKITELSQGVEPSGFDHIADGAAEIIGDAVALREGRTGWARKETLARLCAPLGRIEVIGPTADRGEEAVALAAVPDIGMQGQAEGEADQEQDGEQVAHDLSPLRLLDMHGDGVISEQENGNPVVGFPRTTAHREPVKGDFDELPAE